MPAIRAELLRFATGLLLVLLLGGHSSLALHTLLVPHGVCAAHGEAIHALDEAESTALVGVERLPTGTAVAPKEASESHGHDHCWLVTRSELQSSAPDARASATPNVAAPQPRLAEQAEASRGRTLILLLAPKQSPPAAA